jgi:hypothetical protein
MSKIKHALIPAGELHHPYNWIVANATERNAISSVTTNDLNKILLQEDTSTAYRLTAASPITWVLVADPVGSSSGAVADHVAAANPHTQYPLAASVSILAGNGMTGGGTLEASRTLTLGTPSTLTTSTTNSVTASTHTHSVTFPVTSVANKTGAVTLVKADVGLTNVDNTSDANKPISDATQAALDVKLADADIGTATNKIPLNQFLGNLAFQDKESFVISPQSSVNPNSVGELTFQLSSDSIASIKVRGSDNVIRRGDIALVSGTPSSTRTVTANTTLVAADKTIRADCVSNAITITLPTASSVTGYIYHIKKVDNTQRAVSITAQSGETIDGVLTAQILIQWQSITIQSNGSSWDII